MPSKEDSLKWSPVQKVWIDAYKENNMLPLLADWRSWKPGNAAPVTTLPDEWGARIAWPAFEKQFTIEKDTKYPLWKNKFATELRHFKANIVAQGAKHVLKLIELGNIPLPGTNIAPMVAQQTTPGKNSTEHLFSSPVTGRHLFEAETRTSLSDELGRERAEGSIPSSQHPGLLKQKVAAMWKSLSAGEQADWDRKATEINDSPHNIYRTQKLLVPALRQVLYTLTSEGRHSAGTAAFTLFYGYRDENRMVQGGSIHLNQANAASSWGEVGSNECESWTRYCLEHLHAPPDETSEVKPLKCVVSPGGEVTFPTLDVDQVTPKDLRYHVEQFLQLDWQSVRQTDIPFIDVVESPDSYLADDIVEDFAPWLKRWSSSVTMYNAAEFLQSHKFKHLFKEPPPLPPVTPKSSKKKAKRSDDVLKHAKGDTSPSKSSDTTVSPAGSAKSSRPEEGLGISFNAFPSDDETDRLEAEYPEFADPKDSTSMTVEGHEGETQVKKKTELTKTKQKKVIRDDDVVENEDDDPPREKPKTSAKKRSGKGAGKKRPADPSPEDDVDQPKRKKARSGVKPKTKVLDQEPPTPPPVRGYGYVRAEAPQPTPLLDQEVIIKGPRQTRSGRARK